ncbi:MAG TPA: DUF3179 domain-containing protein [Dehalococcoidia bacterium]|nr:DUF3179 domain-containing protein [Dehalococcoidia bacterium]
MRLLFTSTPLPAQRWHTGLLWPTRNFSFKLIERDGCEWLQDDQTVTLWVPFTGQAVDGKLSGNALERLHANNVFWFAWNDFYPQTSIWGLG